MTRFRAVLLLLLAAAAPRAGMRIFPDSGGPAVPADSPLRLTFDQPVRFMHKGVLSICDAGTRKAIYTLDMSQIPAMPAASGWKWQRTVGGDKLNVPPLIVSEREAYFAVPTNILSAGKAYYVTLEAGAFVEADGQANPAFAGPLGWSFTVRALPARGLSRYSIAADGSGDFSTLQGALDFLPAGNDTPVTLLVQSGTYPEPVRSVGKNRIRIAGTDRADCILRYANNDAFNSGSTYRAMARLFGNEIQLDNLTFANATPEGGTQAEALFLRGERCIITRCVFLSFQDTMLLEGRVFLSACAISGAVDYIWGAGIAYFDRCVLTSNSDGYIVEARNAKGSGGYVFHACTLLAAEGVKQSYLARDGQGQFPDGQVLWIDTRMGPHIPAVGWQLQAAAGSNPGFGEYNSLDLSGKAIPLAGRSRFARQLTQAEADRFRDPKYVLGGKDQWDPLAVLASGVRANGRKASLRSQRPIAGREPGDPACDLLGKRIPAGHGHWLPIDIRGR